MSKITLELAKKMIESAEKEAIQIGVPVVISIVDDGGNFIACHRMDDALLVSVDLAQNKAWTSVAMKMSTSDLAQLAGPEKELYGINTSNNGRVVVFGGGIPLRKDEQIVGAVGVSGGSVEQDIRVAQSAVQVFSESEFMLNG
ncbi:heme-binding protein [Aneurinibacillus sp. Ricciae_BoGa-3]|uniref:GlcG/HbpS family heme-binding protein n=1 Tax=Aneurinibacillus sp. Ricciae_BoGa-3 TaxID=3022697 RepID=UPI00234003DA|nr:heme-binding protein [Aneurinibacillus sp. Ricciae_BoGa-3]WCK52630.1 heme-binding protein [Aneurinibacillus sp. Ricciae_BoGa-3]